MDKRRIPALVISLAAVAISGLLLVSTVGCGQHTSDPVATTADSTAPAAAPAPAAEPAPAPEAAPVASTGAAEETTGDDEEDKTPRDADQANIVLAQAALPPQQPPANSAWKQGKHYAVIKPVQKTDVGPDKVEVLEMFWYGCPHCYALEPFLQSWEPKKASYIQFTRIPATWGIVHQLHARLFYTLMELKRPDLHMVAFREVQVGDNPLIGRDIPETERIQTDFAKRHGISAADFKKAYDSDAVLNKVRQADEILRRYGVDSVPQIVVNGKYLSDVSAAGGQSQLISLIDDLAAREHNKQ